MLDHRMSAKVSLVGAKQLRFPRKSKIDILKVSRRLIKVRLSIGLNLTVITQRLKKALLMKVWSRLIDQSETTYKQVTKTFSVKTRLDRKDSEKRVPL